MGTLDSKGSRNSFSIQVHFKIPSRLGYYGRYLILLSINEDVNRQALRIRKVQ